MTWSRTGTEPKQPSGCASPIPERRFGETTFLPSLKCFPLRIRGRASGRGCCGRKASSGYFAAPGDFPSIDYLFPGNKIDLVVKVDARANMIGNDPQPVAQMN